MFSLYGNITRDTRNQVFANCERKRCCDLQKLTIRPFSLQYLALRALLNHLSSIENSREEIEKFRHLFDTETYDRMLQNTKYNVDKNFFIQNIGEFEIKKLYIRYHIESADFIFRRLLINRTFANRKLEDEIETVRLWCICKTIYPHYCCKNCGIGGSHPCFYREHLRLENAHYSYCENHF